jgi:hypothetical protein
MPRIDATGAVSKAFPLHRARRQRGIAALELALAMPIFVLLLTFPLFLGRAFWHYTVIERAAHDAARYLSSIPLNEMQNSTRAGAVTAVAKEIVDAEIAEFNTGTSPPGTSVLCGASLCFGFSAPATVRIIIDMGMVDPLFPDSTGIPLAMTADVSYQFLGQ